MTFITVNILVIHNKESILFSTINALRFNRKRKTNQAHIYNTVQVPYH